MVKSIFDDGQRRVFWLGAMVVFFGVTAHSMFQITGLGRPSKHCLSKA